MSYLPLHTVQFLANEFEKKLSGFSIKRYKYNDYLTVFALDDSLLLLVELYGTPASPCSSAEEMYGKARNNKFLEFPVEGKQYYTIRIAELTPNQIGFKYNHAKFIREMEEITNIWLLDCYFSYAKFGSEKTLWWNPEGPEGSSLTDRINSLMPELHLSDRIAAWDGQEYNFIILELEDIFGHVHRAVAYTTQKPHSYITQICNKWIETGSLHGDAISSGIIERDMQAAFDSWKGMRRKQRLEEHFKYLYITHRLKDKFDAYSISRQLYLNANIGKYDSEVRGTFLKPVNKWVSEELVYTFTKKLYKDYAVIYQHRPFFLQSSFGGQMSYDVFISKLNVAIEYQGKQHFEPIEFFGGEESFKKVKIRDKEKAELSAKNGVKLVYINYWENITPKLILERVGIEP